MILFYTSSTKDVFIEFLSTILAFSDQTYDVVVKKLFLTWLIQVFLI